MVRHVSVNASTDPAIEIGDRAAQLVPPGFASRVSTPIRLRKQVQHPARAAHHFVVGHLLRHRFAQYGGRPPDMPLSSMFWPMLPAQTATDCETSRAGVDTAPANWRNADVAMLVSSG